MTWGNNNAGPVGVPPTGPNPNAGQMVGTGGGTATPLYAPSFESIMAAVSRGEVSLNQIYKVAGLGGLGNANGNPTLMQAISQGVPQNGTNGIGVVSGPGIGAGNGGVANPQISGNGGLGGAVMALSGVSATNFGGAQIADPKQMVNDGAVALASPIQYGGN